MGITEKEKLTVKINETKKSSEAEKQDTKNQREFDLPYSLEVCDKLRQEVDKANLIRSYPPSRYETGDLLHYNLTAICPDEKATATLEIEKFVGGGFAGQVYRVKLVEIEQMNSSMAFSDLKVGNVYAIKILIPPSNFSHSFRNLIYWLAYQGPFAAQTHYSAARVGVLWQKLIRRAAKIYLDSEDAVVNTYATFYDNTMDSFGEVNEWITGRNWKFEIDDEIFKRKNWKKFEEIPDDGSITSAEFLTKRKFMADLVKLLHDMGAPELARQYEWSTMKSQPNALKRTQLSKNNYDGVTAIDFRAGLALLPFLPMSPADFKLIIKGLFRGKLVQFDRANYKKLDEFIEKYEQEFIDLKPVIEELKVRDPQYRESLPDLTHHWIKLIYKKKLRKSVRAGIIKGWKCKGLVDEKHSESFNSSVFKFILFYLLGLIPFLGRFFRRLWGNDNYSRHIKSLFSTKGYFGRVLKAKQALTLIDWYRDGRVTEERVLLLLNKPFSFWRQRFLISWLPPKWFRFLTDGKFAWEAFKFAVTYPVRFYRDAEFREQWLLENVNAGHDEGMLSEVEADYIRDNIKDPFIQKYLKCVAVHVATLPITQVISLVAAIYAMIAFGKTWAEGLLYAGIVLAAFQATPISPGSLVRGTYVIYLMIKERDIKNYWIAALISFWHYVGYLGFPIQMVAKFPALSRLMAGRWATSIVHIIPVFGERGALLEHWIFDLFFNVPISLRKKMKREKK
ncbi:hypothetical protein H8E88_19040 [candidate division KSB1 bacterium]|nr:hypothetical protein [candidate division KSB1 bacterium]MBL7093274.1 hypothetical protein [candidate division KSB1 bacterium]